MNEPDKPAKSGSGVPSQLLVIATKPGISSSEELPSTRVVPPSRAAPPQGSALPTQPESSHDVQARSNTRQMLDELVQGLPEEPYLDRSVSESPLEEDVEENTDEVTPLPFINPDREQPEAEKSPWRPNLGEGKPSKSTNEQMSGASAPDFQPQESGEPFTEEGAARMGIVGGKGSGKTYLFTAMVARTYNPKMSGVLYPFIHSDPVQIFTARSAKDSLGRILPARFLSQYSQWLRLDQTKRETQNWYRLRLAYRMGLLGRTRSTLDVDFFDVSGEALAMERLDQEQQEVWASYLKATVMVFCLPSWVAFPNERLTLEDWKARELMLQQFDQVVHHYSETRRRAEPVPPVSAVLALTMADDYRCALEGLQQRWIHPFMRSNKEVRELRRPRGVARYLDAARRVSELLAEEFDASPYADIARIPGELNFGGPPPWLIAVSAIDGGSLDDIEGLEATLGSPVREAGGSHPVPVHVELPLLLALCARHNALM